MIMSNFSYLQHSLDATNLLQLSMSSSYESIHNIFIMGWIVGILGLVFCLMVSMKTLKHTFKFANSDSMMEVLWLIMPSFILISLSIPTLLMLYQTDQQHLFDKMSLKTTGMQWYWSYEIMNIYQNNDDNTTNSYMDSTNSDRLTYLSSEQELHLPSNTEIMNMISASDVMHCWTIPNMMLKVDAIPGRVNTVSLLFEELSSLSKFYGQCSELCGANHSFMPISIVVS